MGNSPAPEASDGIFLSLVIPSYNEKDRITSTVATVEAYLESLDKPCEIIVVDDGSSEDSRRIIEDSFVNDPSVRVISYQPNRGKGYAVRSGMLASRGDYAAFSDVDLSAPIEELEKLFAAIDAGADVAIGSRAVKGSQLVVHQPLYRELGGKALRKLVGLLALADIHDTQCGFKLFKGDVARRVFAKCVVDGWGFDVEALYLARRMGYSVSEVPVRWSHSADSKVTNPFRAGLQVLRDAFRMRLRRYDL